MAYGLGQQVKLTATFTSAAGSLVDPTDVTCEVRSPAGTVSTYTYSGAGVTRDGLGIFSRLITLSAAGHWDYTFRGTGAVIAAPLDASVFCDPSVFSYP